MLRLQEDRPPVEQLLLLSGRLKNHALVLFEVFQRKVGRVAVGSVLPAKDLPVPGHWARVNQQKVQAAAGPLTNTRVRDRCHHTRNIEVPSPEGNVGELVGVPPREDDVVH